MDGSPFKESAELLGWKTRQRGPHITTRWTGAAVVRLVSGVIGSRLSPLAPPGQLDRSALLNLSKGVDEKRP